MIIDSHTHVHALPGHPWDSPPERILKLMDSAGITAAAIMPYSDATAKDTSLIGQTLEWVAASGGRLLPFARLAPGAGATELLVNLVEKRGFLGLKLHPVGFRAFPDDPGVIELIETAGRLGVPALFHSGDEEFTLPLQILRAAVRCPGTRIILGHMGGYFHVGDAMAAAAASPNIILETSAMPYPCAIAKAVEAFGPERVIFGSDGPGCLPALEVDKVRTANLAPDHLERVMSRSFLELLRPDHKSAVMASLPSSSSLLSNQIRATGRIDATTRRSCAGKSGPINPRENLPALHDHRVHLHCSSHLAPAGPGDPGVSGFGSGPPDPGGSLESIRKAMAASKRVVSCTLIPGYCLEGYSAANDAVFQAATDEPAVFTPVPRVNPGNQAEIRWFLALLRAGKTPGLFVHPLEDAVRINSPTMKVLFSEVTKAGGYLMVAAGYPIVSEAEGVADLAASCPAGKLVATSAAQIDICGMHLAHARMAMEQAPNLVAETSGIYRQDFIEALIRDFGRQRVVFGSGFPRFNMTFETRRITLLEGPEPGRL